MLSALIAFGLALLITWFSTDGIEVDPWIIPSLLSGLFIFFLVIIAVLTKGLLP